jgi:hypothetical protein
VNVAPDAGAFVTCARFWMSGLEGNVALQGVPTLLVDRPHSSEPIMLQRDRGGSSATERKMPRLRRRRVSLAKKPSTALSQEHEVGAKCRHSPAFWKIFRYPTGISLPRRGFGLAFFACGGLHQQRSSAPQLSNGSISSTCVIFPPLVSG